MSDQIARVPVVLPSLPTLDMHAAPKVYVDAKFASQETAPSSPTVGMEWVRPSTGRRYTWYDDGTSIQWVEFDSADIELDDTGNIDGGRPDSVYGGIDPIICGGP